MATFRISDLVRFANRALEAFDRYLIEQNAKPSVTVLTRYYTTELEISETDPNTAVHQNRSKSPNMDQ
jgi:hypothetical protein